MPRTVNTWQRSTTNVNPGCVQCPWCDGWGGHDWGDGCSGFGGRRDKWEDCVHCQGTGEVIEQYAEYFDK